MRWLVATCGEERAFRREHALFEIPIDTLICRIHTPASFLSSIFLSVK